MALTKYRLQDIAEVVGGGTPSTLVEENYGGEIVWITPKDLSNQNSKFIEQGERSISDKGFNSCSAQMIPAYNILMSSRAPIGLLAINKVECCTNQGFKSLILNKSICDVDYIYYYLKHHFQEIEGLGTGTTFKEVSKGSLLHLGISIPPLEEQQIKARLLSCIDAKIALNRSINHNLEAMAKQLYDYWFVQFDFPDENGKPYKSSGGKMVWNDILTREIPEDWNISELNKWLEIKSGFAFKSDMYVSQGTYKVITIKNVQDHHLETTNCDFVNEIPQGLKAWCRLSVNDRLISLTGNCGRLCLVTEENLLLNQRVGLLSCREDILDYAYLLLSSKEFQTLSNNLAMGAAQANLSPVELCKSMAIIPPEKLLEAFNQWIRPIIGKFIQNEIQITTLIKQRNELLPLLMNGQVKVGVECSRLNYDLLND